MGTTAEKGQRVLQSIAEVQEGINNIGGSLTDQTPFKNFRAELGNIYNNLPKTDYEEGSNITLENCLKGKIDYEDDKVGYGDTEQNGTPTPTTPIPVKTVTGEQEVTIRGSQLFQTPSTQTLTDVTLTKNNDGSLDIVGTAGANRDFATDFISLEDTHLKLGGSYYLSVGQTFSGVSIQIVGYNSNNGWVATTSMQSTTQGQAITLFNDNSITKIKFILRVYSGTTINQQNIKIMLNEGSTALPFEPYITPITKTLNLGNIELAEIGTYRDYIYKNNGKWYKHSEIDKIASYNGETISTTYMSTTGQLTTGATVYYGKTATDTEITNTSLISQLEDIYNIMSNNGTTIIEINGNLPMIIKVRALKGE